MMRRSAPPGLPGARARAGFTLGELLVVLVLLGLVMTGIVGTLARQQRFYRSAGDILEARTQLRNAMAVLPLELRSISSADTRNGTDIYAATDKAIEFRTITGSSLICKKLSTTRIIIPPRSISKGTALTTWLALPVVGDSMLIYDDGTGIGNADDSWGRYRVTAVTPVDVSSADYCGVTTGLTQAADVTAGRVSYEINVQGGTGNQLSGTIIQGAPIRFFHRRRYELYQPSSGSGWYLGRIDCNDTSCGSLTPLSGPFAAYSSTVANSGLSFLYYDAAGTAFVPSGTLTDKQRIARIQLVARADTRGPVDVPGKARGVLRDSLSLDVALRNSR